MSSFSTYFKDKNDKNDFYIAIGIIVLFLGCGLSYGLNLFDRQAIADVFEDDTFQQSGFQFENEEDKTFTTVLLSDKRNIKQVDNWLETSPVQDTSTKIEEEVSDHLSIQNMIESIEANKKTDTIITEIHVDTNKVIAITEQKDTIEIVNNTTTIPTTVTEEKGSTDEKKIKVEQPKSSETKPSKKSNITTTNNNCVIVVGAFSVGENAEKLKRTLIKKGYPAYTFFRKGNRIVGIKQSCDNPKTLQKTLNEIKVKYNKSAWVLKNQ